MRRMIAGGLLLLLAAGSLDAQQSGVVSRVVGALDTKLVDPSCQLKAGDYRVSSGKNYLKTGIETSVPENRARALRDGVRVIGEGIAAGQGSSPAAWYYLGRTYLQQGDLVGADSAFTKAEKLAPTCKAEIDKQRYRAWAALVNGGGQLRKSAQEDSAFILFRAANTIYQGAPLSYINLAELFNGKAMPDSALFYYAKAGATEPTDSAQIQLRNQALFNYGALLLNSGRGADAIPVFERYLQAAPADLGAKKALAGAYRAAGQNEKAQVLEKELVAAAGAAAATGDPSVGAEGLTDADVFDLGIKQFNDKNYKDAAATFGKVLEHQPFYRDALYNQANAYLAVEDGPNLAAVAERMVAIEPLNEYAHSLRQQGYKFAGKTDKVVEAATARLGLPVNVEIDQMKIAGSNVNLTGKVTGRDGLSPSNKPIPPAPMTLVFEFLDQTGNVVGSQEVAIPALKAGDTQPITVDGKAEGVKAWRYRVK